ncbi:GGDEF domain-containing protein [Candidatus Frankia nodulisporulans]|uniref:GGDEF domain-containing protein n=1 Tax=Candidatus Frankia nodulisporulans TaxID=2060052 RepID=UPI0013D018F5|nr:GGDEF domain-containing protein [Candidatus Frankia nodulisporulans]
MRRAGVPLATDPGASPGAPSTSGVAAALLPAAPLGGRAFGLLAFATAVLVAAVLIPQAALDGGNRRPFEIFGPLVLSGWSLLLGVVAVLRTRREERRWRALLTGVLVFVVVGAIQWIVVFGVDHDRRVHYASLNAVHLVPVGLAFLAVLALPGEPRRDAADPCRAKPDLGRYLLMLLDGLLIAGSVLLLLWVEVLGDLHSSGLSAAQYWLGLGTILGSAAELFALLLLLTFGRPRSPRAVALYAAGALCTTVATGASVQWALIQRVEINQTTSAWVGLALGPPLLGLAMLVPPGRRRPGPGLTSAPGTPCRSWGDQLAVWAHVYLPYLPLSAVAGLVVATAARGDALRGVTLTLFITLVALVLIRQMVTVAQNTRLLVSVRVAQQELRYQVLHDPLTGLGNRMLFDAEVADAVQDHRAHGTPVGLLYCDLDEFKAVNDTLGHAAGDELLRAVAGRIRGAVRRGDLAARIGGDEFAVLLRDLGNDPRAVGELTAQRVREAMYNPLRVHGHDRRVSVSVGLAVVAAAGPLEGPEELLRRADRAMYAAKSGRRRRPAAAPDPVAAPATGSGAALWPAPPTGHGGAMTDGDPVIPRPM